MTATELYKAGKLRAALDAQLAEVKSNPADAGRRLFLFELSAFSGDLDRPRRQLEAANHGDPEREAAALQYRALLEAEQKRRALFRDGAPPRLLGEAPEHVRLRLEAV